MNNDERSMWIDNDEFLYRWWRRANMSKRDFIKHNRQELDAYINGRMKGIYGGTAN